MSETSMVTRQQAEIAVDAAQEQFIESGKLTGVQIRAIKLLIAFTRQVLSGADDDVELMRRAINSMIPALDRLGAARAAQSLAADVSEDVKVVREVLDALMEVAGGDLLKDCKNALAALTRIEAALASKPSAEAAPEADQSLPVPPVLMCACGLALRIVREPEKERYVYRCPKCDAPKPAPCLSAEERGAQPSGNAATLADARKAEDEALHNLLAQMAGEARLAWIPDGSWITYSNARDRRIEAEGRGA